MVSVVEYDNSIQKLVVYSIICLMLFLLFWIFKKRYGKVAVNCWFCNSNCKVAYKVQNSWLCPFCEQYNGFDKNGDYNKVLPEMYDEKLNTGQSGTSSSCDNFNKICQEVKFCDKCSKNQILKYKQLSQFQPLNENRFESEVEIYRNKLENLYSLCSKCQSASSRYIKLQDTILRGRMLSHLKPNRKNTKIKNSHVRTSQFVKFLKNSQSLVQIMIHFTMLLFVTIFIIVYFSSSSAISSPFSWVDTSFYCPNFFQSDRFSLFIAVSGLLLSIANCYFFHTGVRYLLFWTYFFGMIISTINKQLSFFVNQFQEFLFPNDFLPVLDSVMAIIPICALSCSLVFLSSLTNFLKATITFFKRCNNLKTKKNPSTSLQSDSAMNIMKHPQSNDNQLFSDESENEVESMEIMDENLTVQPDLNGSLNALKLQDNAPNCNLINSENSNDFFAINALPSALHTPPPSRSSSLLSLSSHHSHVATPANPMNKFGSTMHFARSSNELPFQHYKDGSSVGCWTNSPSFSSRSVATSCSVNQTKQKFQNQLQLKRFQDFKKPIISPAKLQLFAKDQAHKQLISDAPKKNYLKLNHSNVTGDYDVDISANDSVSQIGERVYPELSDNDEDVLHTPISVIKAVDHNSSPKSTISNITSLTMKSVAEVENSRACRWVLAACLFLNLILVILLIQEVREMRETEHMKLKTSL